MLSAVLFFFYFILLGFCIRRMTRSYDHAPGAPFIFIAYAVKVVLGCMYGYVFLKYYNGDDTWAYNNRSIAEYEKLVSDPLLFFSELSPSSAFKAANGIIQSIDYYIMDLEDGIMVKLLAIFNIFSRGNYYVNVVLFNFLTFWGHYWLFRLLVEKFPSQKRILLIVLFLFLPVVFWVSGIRADGLLLFFIGLLLNSFYRLIELQKRRALIPFIIALIGITIFRNVLTLLLIPALISWWVSIRFRLHVAGSFIVSYLVCTIIFFASSLFSSSNGLPGIVTNRQARYFSLHGNTRYALDTLQPNVIGFLKVTPQSINNTFLRPAIWEAKGALQVVSALENLLVLGLVLAFVFYKEHGWTKKLNDPVLLTMLFFAITLYLFIGITVPFPGAIVRYKTIGELLLVTVMILLIKPPKLKNI